MYTIKFNIYTHYNKKAIHFYTFIYIKFINRFINRFINKKNNIDITIKLSIKITIKIKRKISIFGRYDW